MKKLVSLLAVLLSLTVSADGVTHIWPSIPFIRGADLCAYNQAYSQTRSDYMQEMTDLASQLMESGAYGSEALQMLVTFDALYDKNRRLATQYKYLDVTLENTLKGYLDQYYSNLKPKKKNIIFKHINRIQRIINDASNGQRTGYLPENTFQYLDYVAYGSYSLAPDCKGKIQVTVTLVGRNGETETFMGEGKPGYVMSQIASRMFERFQRTNFPTQLRVGSRTITLVGALNGSVDTVNDVYTAKMACETLDARLPNKTELEMISAYGDWSGGVSIGRSVWAIANGKVYHPLLRNPSPARSPWEVNAKEFKYYCIR